MKVLRLIRNYFFYCGIEREEYRELKRDAYISNFKLWRALHIMLVVVFATLFISSLLNGLMGVNRLFYLAALLYSIGAALCFFILRKDALIAQFLIYLSIAALFLFACFVTANKPELPATAFIVFILIAPMFMIDKPYFMAIELGVAATVFLVWMYQVKPYEIWRIDLINVLTFTPVGVVLNVLANSIRIKEFVLTRQINIQKDTDELTGLKNKSALTRKINRFLADDSTNKGIMFLFDIDRFKAINDTYGHDVGDDVISQLGRQLGGLFTGDEIVGRFGGDEFIVFLKNTDDREKACSVARDILRVTEENVTLPDRAQKVDVSIGIAIYSGSETDYSKIFRKADKAMYRAKADPENKYCIFSE